MIKWFLEQCPFLWWSTVIGWDNPSQLLSGAAPSVKKAWEMAAGNKGSLCDRKKSGWAEWDLTWIPTSMACSKWSFEKIQPCLTLTIGEILFYLPLQGSQGKAKFLCLCICITITGTFAYFIYPVGKKTPKNNKKAVIKWTMIKYSSKKYQHFSVNFLARSFRNVWNVYVLTEVNKLECINQLVIGFLHSKSPFPVWNKFK